MKSISQRRRIDLSNKKLDNSGRQLPYPKFIEVITRERTDLQRSHAQWAGMSLAEFVVGRHIKLEKLSPVKIEKMRKRYQVAPQFVKEMLATAKATVRLEQAWQFSGSH
jgi:DNA-binding transcriptional regulator YiaG